MDPDYSSRILKGSLIIFLAGIISSLLGYLIRIVLARKLTVEEFGLFFAIYNVILLVGWIKGFGLSSAIGKYIPKFKVDKDNDSIKSIIIIVTLFTFLSNILFLAIIYFFPTTIINSYFQSSTAREILLMLFIYIFIDGLSTITNSYFLSTYRFILYSLRDILIRLVVLVAIFFIYDLTLLEVAIIYIVAASLNLLVNIFYFFRSFSFFRYRIKINKKMGKELLGFSVPLIIRDMFGVLMARVDNVLLVYFRPLAEVGLYNVILPTADLLLIFSRPFGRIMFPLSSELLALNEKERINVFLQKIHQHLLLLLLPLSIVIFTFSSLILKTLFGPTYETGHIGLTILVFGFLLTSINMVSYSVLLGVGKQKEAAAITILSNIINIVLNLLLIPYFGNYGVGYIGAIIGTLMSTICLSFLLWYHLRKSINYNFPKQWSFLLILIGISLAVVGYFIKKNIFGDYSQVLVFLASIILLYPLLVFTCRLTTLSEIKFIVNTLFRKKENVAKDSKIPPPKKKVPFLSLWWYIQNPRYYSEFFHQAFQKMKDTFSSRQQQERRMISIRWCAERAVDTETVVSAITGIKSIIPFEEKFKEQFHQAQKAAADCPIRMGGPGDLTLIYYLTEHLQATRVVETGVAYGWSSFAVLQSLQHRPSAVLISTDKPYPGQGNEPYVGCVVPEKLRRQWVIIHLPDLKAVPLAIERLGSIDLSHYDSDKSYGGRMKTYPLLWESLRSGGIFISDDIGDNLAFKNFCEQIKSEPFIVKSGDKYIGVLIK